MRIAPPHVFPKARRVLLHTGVRAGPSHQRNKLHTGRHATETLHKVATTWQKETEEGPAKEPSTSRSAKGKYTRREGRAEGGGGVEIMSSRPGPASARYKTSPTCRQ